MLAPATVAVADSPPTVALTSPARDEVVTGPDVSISGTAGDDIGVVWVGVAVRQLSTGLWLRPDGSYGAFKRMPATLTDDGAGGVTWQLDVTLTAGDHGVSIRSRDTAGTNSPTPWSVFEVTVDDPGDPGDPGDPPGPDETPPVVTVTSPARKEIVAEVPTVITGTASDDTGVTRSTVALRDRTTGQWLRPDGSWGAYANLPTSFTPGAQTDWSFNVDLAPGEYGVQAAAWDAADNRSDRPWVPFTVAAPPPDLTATLLAAGDVANCNGQEAATGALLQQLAGTVAVLGDLAYPDGSVETFRDCYDPTWGPVKDRTRPAIGNHDVHTDDGGPYYDYFGAAAGPRGLGYYSYDVGAWHVVVLNTNCDLVGGCGVNSPQMAWLRDDLADAGPNIVAYWHHPRFSTGSHGDTPWISALWRELDEAGADLVLSGHDHSYQRFEPMDADGNPTADGMRQFVVGTGGTTLTGFLNERPGVESRQHTVHGILELTLEQCGYAWQFHGIDGQTHDTGSFDGTC